MAGSTINFGRSPGPQRGIMISLGFDENLLVLILREAGVTGWNLFFRNLLEGNLTAGVWSPGERPPLVDIGFDFSRMDMSRRNLDGIDLDLCWMEGTCFDEASLKGAKLGCCPKASFRGACLLGATIHEITGCDFTDACLDGAVLAEALYDLDDPPTGLPADLFDACQKAQARAKQIIEGQAAPGEFDGFDQFSVTSSTSLEFIPLKE